MPPVDPCLIRSAASSGEAQVRLGVPLLDDYLRFVEGRARPNTLLATAYDLAVFFGVVGKAPAEVTATDVLAFIAAQRTGSDGRRLRAGRPRACRHVRCGAGCRVCRGCSPTCSPAAMSR